MTVTQNLKGPGRPPQPPSLSVIRDGPTVEAKKIIILKPTPSFHKELWRNVSFFSSFVLLLISHHRRQVQFQPCCWCWGTWARIIFLASNPDCASASASTSTSTSAPVTYCSTIRASKIQAWTKSKLPPFAESAPSISDPVLFIYTTMADPV